MKLIYVKWLDASIQYEQLRAEDFDDDYSVETAGILARETDKTISVAMDYCDKNDNYRHIIHIPKKYIIKKRIFKL